MIKPNIVCFGEVLWDCFPDGDRLGGAPLNVAIRLADLGVQVALVSALGNDTLGELALDLIHQRNVLTTSIQHKGQFPTGTVAVQLDPGGSASYTIKPDAAWDYITANAESISLVAGAQLFVYGSLAARSASSYFALKSLLSNSSCNVFDVNLRAPHYSKDSILELTQFAHVLKINDEELGLLCAWLEIPKGTLESQLRALAGCTNTDLVCVTLGAEGAAAWQAGEFVQIPGFNVVVCDTVGAGDSFLARFIYGVFLKKETLFLALKHACAMGAIVASKPGATLEVSPQEIQALIAQ